MFVYNLTIKIDNEILYQWIKWMKEEYIPGIMATNLFNDNKFFKLLEPYDDPDTSTFILQHFTDQREKYNKFINDHADKLNEECLKRWKDNIFTFSTLMQIVH